MSGFSRRYPAGAPGSAVQPVSSRGWAVVGVFVAGMVLAGLAFALVGVTFGIIWGAIAFGILTLAAGGAFIYVAMRWTAPAKLDGDNHHA